MITYYKHKYHHWNYCLALDNDTNEVYFYHPNGCVEETGIVTKTIIENFVRDGKWIQINNPYNKINIKDKQYRYLYYVNEDRIELSEHYATEKEAQSIEGFIRIVPETEK